MKRTSKTFIAVYTYIVMFYIYIHIFYPEIHIMDSSISWDSLDWSLTPPSGVANFNPDDRPITPLHKTFSSGQNLYNDFEDGKFRKL